MQDIPHTPEISEESSPLKKEKKFLWRFFQYYFFGSIAMYFCLYARVFSGDFEIILIFAPFVIPTLVSIFYFFRAIYLLLDQNLEAFKFALLVMIISALIGAGVCAGNIQFLSF